MSYTASDLALNALTEIKRQYVGKFNIEDGKFYTSEEISEILKVHIDSVRRWIRDEELAAIKLGKSYRILGTDIKGFLTNRIRPVRYLKFEDGVYNMKKAAQALGVSRTSLYRYITNKELTPRISDNRFRYFIKQDLEDFMQRHALRKKLFS